jgi:glucose/arabinose dehydrogenase
MTRAAAVVILLFACTLEKRKEDRRPRVTSASAGSVGASACDANAGVTLPAGFCATIFVDGVGAPRHLVIAPNGDVFVALMRASSGGGGVLALRDTDADGRADIRESFGKVGGTGIGLSDGYLYHDQETEIVRYPLKAGALTPGGPPETIVAGLPSKGHVARNLVIDGANLFVNFGSRTNACQQRDRGNESPGLDPCRELEERAGIWRFDSRRSGQRPQRGERWATGIRNAVGMARQPESGQLWATQHGRDQLLQNWPKLFNAEQGAEKPAEELMPVSRGDDFGWPYCYFDGQQRKLVLAPEYGGDGQKVGRCAEKTTPAAFYPGHWAPNALAFYAAGQFPARYRGGAFIAFHGSWNRAPLPQEGFRVVFQPFAGGKPSGDFESFATPASGNGQSTSAFRRPTGLAVGPDGALYVSDDASGTIWRVVYVGKKD